MRCFLYTLCIFGVLDLTHTQSLAMGPNRSPPPGVSCDDSRTALVEHFFNVIFNEFHNTPPVCVCVQMCPDQPTYCYPSGCFKQNPDKKPEHDAPVVKINENSKPLMLFIDENDKFATDMFGNRVDESKQRERAEKTFINKLRPDPFKNKYKMLFRYKKTPRIELRYHHGEQVKNIKSDSNKIRSEYVDVSNTRWPSNKNRRSNKKIYLDPQKNNRITLNDKFLTPRVKDSKMPSYPSKYFKRDLRNVTDEKNEPNDSFNIETIYIVGKKDAENTRFSLETLIDDIIESSYDQKSTVVDAGVDDITKGITTSNRISELIHEVSNESDTTTEPIIEVIKENVTAPNNESTHIISINLTNETVDKNMYLEDDSFENTTGTYSNMIATLSKKIDMQNNTSLEMMRRVVGDLDIDSTIITPEEIIRYDSHVEDTTPLTTTENIISSVDYGLKVTKKNKQKFVRKLQNGKTY